MSGSNRSASQQNVTVRELLFRRILDRLAHAPRMRPIIGHVGLLYRTIAPQESRSQQASCPSGALGRSVGPDLAPFNIAPGTSDRQERRCWYYTCTSIHR